jgi:hypothetical protein
MYFDNLVYVYFSTCRCFEGVFAKICFNEMTNRFPFKNILFRLKHADMIQYGHNPVLDCKTENRFLYHFHSLLWSQIRNMSSTFQFKIYLVCYKSFCADTCMVGQCLNLVLYSLYWGIFLGFSENFSDLRNLLVYVCGFKTILLIADTLITQQFSTWATFRSTTNFL